MIVVIAVLVMVFLGIWQLDRHSEKSNINERISLRLDNEPLALADLDILRNNDANQIEEYEYRSIALSGQYKQQDSILVRNRTFNGSPGFWLLTPLELPTSEIIIVNRGWIPISAENYVDTNTSIFQVSGVLRKTELAKGLQRADLSDGILKSLARVDLSRYKEQLDYEIFPMYIQLINQTPQQVDGFPKMLDSPKFSEGQHLNYAVQGFIFATIAGLGYPLVLWRFSKGKGPKKRKESDIPIDYL